MKKRLLGSLISKKKIAFTIATSIILFQKRKYFYANSEIIPGEYKKELKDYKVSEVLEHKTEENRVWVIYKNGVYDITDFLKDHPGKKLII
jgi:cytochrome b involved in lipid metabolism